MAAPDYVPVPLQDRPRTLVPTPPAGHWTADRPGDLHTAQPMGPKFGRPGPDQGYGLKLANRFRDRLFDGAHHHYEFQRAIADAVPDETLRLTPLEVARRLPEWRSLLVV